MYNSLTTIVNYSMPTKVYNSCAAQHSHLNYCSNFFNNTSFECYNKLSDSDNYSLSDLSDYSSNKIFFNVDPFINTHSQPSAFIDSAKQIKHLIEDAFKATTGENFPSDIIISVCDDKKMKTNHPDWHPGISGFAINSYPRMVFVRNDSLEKVMVTLGHEIGHVLSNSLDYDIDEEAKAFAFSIAWIKAIKDNNIGNLSENLVIPEPAHNGIHNAALKFVLDKIRDGVSAFDLFDCLASKEVSSFSNFLFY